MKVELVTKSTTRDYAIIANETSKMECLEYRKIRLTELGEDFLCLKVPKSACASGHIIRIYIFYSNKHLKTLKKFPNDLNLLKHDIALLGKVVESNTIEDGQQVIQVALQNECSEEWSKFLEKYEKKQETISSVFDKYKDR